MDQQGLLNGSHPVMVVMSVDQHQHLQPLQQSNEEPIVTVVSPDLSKEAVVATTLTPLKTPIFEDPDTKREKARVRQEKNRVAAKKCRERKQQYYLDLERSTEQLKETNRALLTQIELLNAELERYRVKLENAGLATPGSADKKRPRDA